MTALYFRGFVTGTLASLATLSSYKWYTGELDETIVKGWLQGSYGQNTAESAILKYGIPDRGPVAMYYTNHVLSYDQARKTPVWVAEHITKDCIKGNANRKHCKFKPDPNVPAIFTAKNGDYWKSGWSRGHMAPAGDNKYDQLAMEESFYLSNIVPQDLDNNAGFWNRLEMYTRDLTIHYQDVYVISGPLTLPNIEEKEKKFVKYEVIGESEVPVPTHLYKIILAENDDLGVKALGAFIVPNEPITSEHPLSEFQVSLSKLEQAAGLIFLKDLNRDNVKDLCIETGCKLISKDKFELYMVGRKLESAKSVEDLDNVWNEMGRKKLKPDKYLIDLYEKRYLEFQQLEQKQAEL